METACSTSRAALPGQDPDPELRRSKHSPQEAVMETRKTKSRDRVSKRASNACVRCRRLKIKCSGSQPCDGCLKRQVSCEVDIREHKIVVTRGYIMDLQQALRAAEQSCAARQDREETASYSTGTHTTAQTTAGPVASQSNESCETLTRLAGVASMQSSHMVVSSASSATPVSDDQASTAIQPTSPDSHDQIDEASSTVENPLSLRHTEFTTSPTGVTHYMGTSSNWSFLRRILNLVHSQLCDSPAPPQTLLFDGHVYDIDWSSAKACPDDTQPLPELPTLDHAIYLINTVQFNCCQLFHLFDMEEFMENCHRFYANPKPEIASAGLWYLHFCFVIALGKAFQSRRPGTDIPFGLDFFLSVFRQFPSTGTFIQQPLAAVEILCCAVLCLQCIDHRYHAHIMIGEAMRISLFHGWHTDMRDHGGGERYIERCRRAWWTVYLLDREMTSLLGIPLCVNDVDITCPLPVYGGQPQRKATLGMQVKLCRIIADISRSLYGNDGSLHFKYLSRAKNILGNIADLAEELRTDFPLQPRENLSGISRTASHLHLLYHRCITLVTRPLLYYLIKMRLSSSDDYFSTLESMKTVRNLVRLCIETSQSMISILFCLMTQGLLGSFFPYDTEAVFVSTTNLLLGPAVDSQFSDEDKTWLDKAYDIFDDMINHGNQVAKFRKAELQQLGELLAQYKATRLRRLTDTTEVGDVPRDSAITVGPGPRELASSHPHLAPATHMRMGHAGDGMLPSPETDTHMSNGELPRMQIVDPILGEIFGAGFSREHLMGVADAIDDEDMAWMCESILEHDIS